MANLSDHLSFFADTGAQGLNFAADCFRISPSKA
jgi:hypothetical protein